MILDGRYESEYSGERVKPGTGFDYGAKRHGRIPGARHLMPEAVVHAASEERT